MEKMQGMMRQDMQMGRESKGQHPMMKGMRDTNGMDNKSGEQK
jgi:hypothetical protein